MQIPHKCDIFLLTHKVIKHLKQETFLDFLQSKLQIQGMY